MTTIYQTKELEVTDSPILVFDCTLADGTKEHWSTQPVNVGGTTYSARIGRHNLFEFQTASDQGVDSVPRVMLELANADSHLSEIERASGFKGAKLTVTFVFFNLQSNEPTSEAAVLFQGIVNSPELITETTFRLTAMNRLSSQRVFLPQVRIQRRCVWDFPATADQRVEAASGGADGRFSRFYGCGYSPDAPNGVGSLKAGVPFQSCAFTRTDCEARGMFNADALGRQTARFSGIEFVPSTITVRSSGESGSHLSPVQINEARYNDFVPLIYGTAWLAPNIVFARNDGNLTRMEVLLGMGPVTALHKVLVNGIEIPQGRSGLNMTGTGWYNVVSYGTRNGEFNRDFTDSHGNPLGDPYGSMAYLSVVVPNRISDGTSLPKIQVLVDGLELRTYTREGQIAGDSFSNNPCWIILDILLRSGWVPEEIDLSSFYQAANYCDQTIQTVDPNQNKINIPRFQCNLVLQNRRSLGDVLRGIRNGSRLYFTFGFSGLLQLNVENTIAIQQPSKRPGTNATDPLNGGWPAYEFGDGTNGLSGILRASDGSSTVRLSARTSADCPNRYSVEFQDAFNEYQQDSFSVVDADDVAKTGQEIAVTLNAYGIPNYDQAARALAFNLNKSVRGNVIVEFKTSVKALGLFPGDIITITYLKEGFQRQPFRIVKVSPGYNFRTVTITAQLHDDPWYTDSGSGNASGRRLSGGGIGFPRPIAGTVLDENGILQFGITESAEEVADGTTTVSISVEYVKPTSIAKSAPGIPYIDLSPSIQPSGGTLSGSQTLYYCVSSVDTAGNEGDLSFVVRATIAGGTNTNVVSLAGLSFPASASGFHVYRGPNPSELFRIATNEPIDIQFQDNGLPPLPILPPDPSFDHVNFYWRLEDVSEVPATIRSNTSIGNSLLQMTTNQYRGATVRISRGLGVAQERSVIANDATTVTIDSPWDALPDSSSSFVLAESGVQFGATSKSSPIQFAIPNRSGAVIHIIGRSANGNDAECPFALSPLTRWQIGQAGGLSEDLAAPGAPTFGLKLSTTQGGTVELDQIGFSDLGNTRSISAGTFIFHYYDELTGPPSVSTAGDLSPGDAQLVLATRSSAIADDFVQVEDEILKIEQISEDGLTFDILRGQQGTAAATHPLGSLLYVLDSRTVIVPFIKNFFGTPASGDWTYSLPFPNVRIASAQLFVTNSRGNSTPGTVFFTDTLDSGLRTLSGGQYAFQVGGFLAIQTGAAPDISVEGPHAIRDVFAICKASPAEGGINADVRLNDVILCSLTIPAGATISNQIRGLMLPALKAGDRLSLDITEVGQVTPGSDLTVVMRL